MATLRVMIFDADAQRAAVIGDTLRRQGCEVLGAESCADICRRVVEAAPDVVVIDVDSPDGETLEHLGMLAVQFPRPVVMFTHDGGVERIRSAIRAGVSAYVVDGLTADRIRPVIEVAIARFELHRDAASAGPGERARDDGVPASTVGLDPAEERAEPLLPWLR